MVAKSEPEMLIDGEDPSTAELPDFIVLI